MKRFGEVFTEFNGDTYQFESEPSDEAFMREASKRGIAAFQFTPRLSAALKAVAERQNTTMAALVRRYITEAVNRDAADESRG